MLVMLHYPTLRLTLISEIERCIVAARQILESPSQPTGPTKSFSALIVGKSGVEVSIAITLTTTPGSGLRGKLSNPAALIMVDEEL